MRRIAVVVLLSFASFAALDTSWAADPDPVLGKRQFAPCSACHTLEEGGPNKIGPNLHGLLGRKAGSKSDFVYSAAMKKAGFVWDEKKLDAYITKPQSVVPGNKMAFMGVAIPENRANLIAYLKDATK